MFLGNVKKAHNMQEIFPFVLSRSFAISWIVHWVFCITIPMILKLYMFSTGEKIEGQQGTGRSLV